MARPHQLKVRPLRMPRMEATLCLRSRFIEFLEQCPSDLLNTCGGVNSLFFLNCVSDVTNNVGKLDAPCGSFRSAFGMPHANVQSAVKALLRDPSAKHLNRVFVALCGWWND